VDALGIFEANVEAALQHEVDGDLDAAVRAYVEGVRTGHEVAMLYEHLLRIHLHRREIDAAWCAASMIAAVGELEGKQAEMYEDYTPRRLPALRRALDAAEWQLLCAPCDTAISAVLAPRTAELAPKPTTVRALDPGVVAWAATAFGVGPGAEAIAAGTSLDEAASYFTLRERRFAAGRQAARLRAPHLVLAWATPPALERVLAEAGVPGDVRAWQASLLATEMRAGLLVCGEPKVARHMLMAETTSDDLLADVAAFSVSPAHHRLRAVLGLAVDMGQ
jgi:hypothetical protein